MGHPARAFIRRPPERPKHLATALMLVRTEVLGLNAWLANASVPGVSPRCPCDWHEQTIQHVFFGCPRYEVRSDSLVVILSRTASAQAAARWFVETGLLQLAAEIDEEDVSRYEPLPVPDTW